jgi:hypothetical protein
MALTPEDLEVFTECVAMDRANLLFHWNQDFNPGWYPGVRGPFHFEESGCLSN